MFCSAVSLVDAAPTSLEASPELTTAPDVSQPPPSRSLDLKDRWGLAFVSAPLDVRGLAINRGITSHIFIETILGGSWNRTSADHSEFTFGSALGIHAKLLQSASEHAYGRAAFTVGARAHLYFSNICEPNTPCDPTVSHDLTERVLLDLPLRIYWFPIPNFSIHSELNLSLYWRSTSTSSDALGEAYRFELFEHIGRLGKIGMTFWF